MRVLLAVHSAYVEPTNGAARSIRTIMEWLADAGHDCRAVTTGRFEQSLNPDIERTHAELGVDIAIDRSAPRPIARYELGGVAVAAICSRHNDRLDEDHDGTATFAAVLQAELDQSPPEIMLTYGWHDAVMAAMATARHRAIRTIYTVRAWGYFDARWYRHADRVLMNSRFAADKHHERLGLRADWLPSPFIWSDIRSDEAARGFVTFINPSAHKGAALFARLADMLGTARPDIPLLIVNSGAQASELADIEGLDLRRHGSILTSPPIADMRNIYALTRILLVPSTFAEPFGRVAAEAMINGIPPLVSDRGALPETVGHGGTVLPIPDWLTPDLRVVPTEAEVRPWFDAIVRLWDDPAHYAERSAAARAAAQLLYDEAGLRARYVAYFTDRGPFAPVLPG